MVATKNRKLGSSRRGQGMTEYIIIVSLVAVALITIITLFGNKIKFLFTAATDSIDKGKVVEPRSLSDGGADMKGAVGDDQADLGKQATMHNLKHTKSGETGN